MDEVETHAEPAQKRARKKDDRDTEKEKRHSKKESLRKQNLFS